MAPIKLLKLLAISSVAIFACSRLSSVHALSLDSDHLVRNARSHNSILKRTSSPTLQRRCARKPHAAVATSTSSAKPTSTTHASSGGSSGGTGGHSSGSGSPPPPPPPPPPSPPHNSGGTGSGKAGLAWPNGADPALAHYKTDHVTRLYTWSPFIPQLARDLGFEVIPMCWGWNQGQQCKETLVRGYANTVLGQNEPNEPGQSNMGPGEGASFWKQYLQPLKNEGYKLIGPACSSNPNGKVWTRDFMAACDGCTFDGLAVHWYDVKAQDFIAYITDYHNTFGLDIWVTEFACQNFNGGAQCTQQEVFDFMATVTHFMDNTPWVVSYFAFGAMHNMQGVNPANQLMSPDGTPTSLGHFYIRG